MKKENKELISGIKCERCESELTQTEMFYLVNHCRKCYLEIKNKPIPEIIEKKYYCVNCRRNKANTFGGICNDCFKRKLDSYEK